METQTENTAQTVAEALALLENLLPFQEAAQRKQLSHAIEQLRSCIAELGVAPAVTLSSDDDFRVTPEMAAWGRLLRERREGARLTRAQLAVLAGVADSTIRNI